MLIPVILFIYSIAHGARTGDRLFVILFALLTVHVVGNVAHRCSYGDDSGGEYCLGHVEDITVHTAHVVHYIAHTDCNFGVTSV